jgi:hypothetical protein
VLCYGLSTGFSLWKTMKGVFVHEDCEYQGILSKKQIWPYNDPWVVSSRKKFVKNTQLTFLPKGLLAALIYIPNGHSILWEGLI